MFANVAHACRACQDSSSVTHANNLRSLTAGNHNILVAKAVAPGIELAFLRCGIQHLYSSVSEIHLMKSFNTSCERLCKNGWMPTTTEEAWRRNNPCPARD